MAEPFETPSPGKLGRIAGLAGGRKRAFLGDVEGLLAKAERLSDVEPSRVEAVAQERGVDLARDVSTPRRSLYRRFLEHCLNDHALSSDESEDLAHLRKLLALGDGDVAAIHDDVTRAIYGDAIDVVLEDHKLAPEEDAFLTRLREEIGLLEETADELKREGARRARDRFVQRAAVHRGGMVAEVGAEIELEGSSELGLQQAVEDAIGRASETLPELTSAKVKDLRVEIREGAVAGWHVKLSATLSRPPS